MKLTGSQIQQIVCAILSGYRSKESLSIMVQVRLDSNLNEICSNGNLREVTFELVNWAISNGCISNLLNAARLDNSDNVQIQEVAALYGCEAQKAGRNFSTYNGQKSEQVLLRRAEFLQAAMRNYCEHRHEQMTFSESLTSAPYKGLLNYETADKNRFFGRSKEIMLLTEHIRSGDKSGKVTVLHAPSGAGKTSLICAGVIPQLSNMVTLYILPRLSKNYKNPEYSIRKRIVDSYQGIHIPLPDFSDISLHRFMKLASTGLDGKPLVIFLDQFEYFFIYQTPEEQEMFISALADCYDDPTLPVKFVLILRKEYFSDLDNFKSAIPTIFQNSVSLSPFSYEQALVAIESPLKQSTIRFDNDLIREILNDLRSLELGRGRIEPVQLQLVCQYLCQEANGDAITLDEYKSSGQAIGILRAYVARAMQEFNIERRAVARKVLATLVTKEKTIRVLTQTELESETNEVNLTALLADLVNARLLRCSESEECLQYELAHQYLIKEIQELVSDKEWHNKDARELLEQEIRKYRVDPSSIISRDRLIALEAWNYTGYINLDDEAESLIEQSRQTHAKEEQNQLDTINFIRMYSLEQIVLGIDCELSSPIASIKSNSNELRLSIEETKFTLGRLPERLLKLHKNLSDPVEDPHGRTSSEYIHGQHPTDKVQTDLDLQGEGNRGDNIDRIIREEGLWHKLEDICDMLDEVQDASQKMAGLLTLLSNFIQPHQPHKMTDVYLQIKNALILLKGRLYNAGIKLEDTTPYNSPCWLMEAPGQLVFLFVCLLLNSIEAIQRVEAADFRGTISIIIDNHGKHEIIEIVDDGIPLPSLGDNHHSTYSSCPENYRQKVGFAIARQIVEKNNGQMVITNLPSRGTSIKLKLPKINLEKGDEQRQS